jgi:hypothetical protein
MRRLLIVGLAGFVLAISTGGVKAARPAGRVVTESYAPNPYHKISIDYGDPGVSIASVELAARPRERSVSVTLVDDSGFPVRGGIMQGVPGSTTRLASFCGETAAPVGIDPSMPVIIDVFSGHCSGKVAAATEGTATVTFFATRAR